MRKAFLLFFKSLFWFLISIGFQACGIKGNPLPPERHREIDPGTATSQKLNPPHESHGRTEGKQKKEEEEEKGEGEKQKEHEKNQKQKRERKKEQRTKKKKRTKLSK